MFGYNLGTFNNSNFSSKIGMSNCLSSGWSSDSHMVCLSPSGVGAQLSSTVSLLGRASVLTLAFSYTRPIISNVSASMRVSTGGNSVTILGQMAGFGFDQSPRSSLSITACAATSWVADSATVLDSHPDFPDYIWQGFLSALNKALSQMHSLLILQAFRT